MAFPTHWIIKEFEFIIGINARAKWNNLLKVVKFWFALAQGGDVDGVLKLFLRAKRIHRPSLKIWQFAVELYRAPNDAAPAKHSERKNLQVKNNKKSEVLKSFFF